MVMAPNNDVSRWLSVVREPVKPPRSPNAEAAARYRARKRGETVAKLKPGRKRTTITELRMRIRELETELVNAKGLQGILEKRLRRQLGTLTIDDAAKDLLMVLSRDDPSVENRRPERRELLRDVVVEIEERQEHWVE